MTTKPTAVYRLFRPDGRLVYIGRSAHPESRIALHRRCTHGWQSDLGEATIEWFASPGAARKAARRATLAEQPENVDMTLDLTPDPAPVVYVYRLYDREDRLLYIGASKDVARRLDAHGSSIPWERYTTEPYPDRASAVAAEGAAILAEGPLMNVMRGKNGPASEARPVRRSVPALRTELRTKLQDGEISAADALFALAEHPQVSPWRAAYMLGLDNGGRVGWRKYRTVEQLLELNGLA